jgi:hypothetical protein
VVIHGVIVAKKSQILCLEVTAPAAL